MFKHPFSIFLSFLVSNIAAQDTLVVSPPARNTIYVELLGQGLYNAFTFDRLHLENARSMTSYSAGITLIPSKDLFVLAVPISYNLLLGKRNHFLELGLGFTVMNLVEGNVAWGTNEVNSTGDTIYVEKLGSIAHYYSYFTPRIGYRFQQEDGGFFARVTLTPAIAFINFDDNFVEYETNKVYYGWSGYSYFKEAAFFPFRVFPWAGVSFGYTF